MIIHLCKNGECGEHFRAVRRTHPVDDFLLKSEDHTVHTDPLFEQSGKNDRSYVVGKVPCDDIDLRLLLPLSGPCLEKVSLNEMEARLICERLLLENRYETPIDFEGSDITPLFEKNRCDIADTRTDFPDVPCTLTEDMLCNLSTRVV